MSLQESGARAAVLAAAISVGLFCSGCGDTFRPVANPEPLPGGDPQRTAHAVVVSSNGSNPGTAVVIDVSGDTNVGTLTGDTFVGRSPVHAASNVGTIYVVNRDDDNVTTFTVPTVGSLLNLGKITLDTGAKPVFVAAAQGKVFVAESGLGMVKDISASSNQSIQVGKSPSSAPVALVATPDGSQLYSLNQGDDTVSVIFPATDQNVTATTPLSLPTGAKPVWGAVSADGARVYVVNQGTNNISVIDTASDTVIQPSNPLPVGAGPNYIFYQASLNRFYVTSPADNSLSIIDNNVDPSQCATNPTLCVQKVSLAGAPCNALHPISVTALADGTRVYVADDMTNSVCVLNTTNNTFTKSIPVGTKPVFIASDPDSTRVFTANSGSGDVSIIQTSSDTTVTGNNGAPLTITTGGTPTFVAITP
jgi:YVTN family beta-propeller protein